MAGERRDGFFAKWLGRWRGERGHPEEGDRDRGDLRRRSEAGPMGFSERAGRRHPGERFIGPWWQSGYGPEMGEPGAGGRGSTRADPRERRRVLSSGEAARARGLGPELPRGPKGYRRLDSRIHEDICDWLTEDDEVDASDIEVRVDEGVVHLSGSVPDRATKRIADQIASLVRGVSDVVNELRVASSQQQPVREAKTWAAPSNGEERR